MTPVIRIIYQGIFAINVSAATEDRIEFVLVRINADRLTSQNEDKALAKDR